MTTTFGNFSKLQYYVPGNETNVSNDTDRSSITASVWTPELITRVAVVMTVMLVTLFGNLCLIYLLTYKKSRRIKRVNIFIINLAVGDLAIALITMSTEILFVAFGEWVLGPFLCKLTVYLQVVTLASATFLLTGMSIDRYQVIVRPMQSLARRPKIWTKALTAWILALVFAAPQLFIFLEEKVKKKDGSTIMKCVSHGYNQEWQRKLYFMFLTSYILLIPSIIMLYCYTNIAKVVWSRGSVRGPTDPNTSGHTGSPRMSVRRNLVSASKQRVVTMTLTVIVGFLSCLTPYFIISLIRIFSGYSIELKEALVISEIIFMCHSAVNPFLYGVFTLQLDHIKSFLSCWRHHGQRRRLRDDLIKAKTLKNRSRYSLRCLSFLGIHRNSYQTTSVIIANHAAREERIHVARNGRKCAVKGGQVHYRPPEVRYHKTRIEKGMRICESVNLNSENENGNVSVNGVGAEI